MADRSRTLRADAVHARLPAPDRWRVEDGGEGAVYGFADGHAEADLPDLPEVPASFSVWKDDDLWTAVWKAPHELGDGLGGVSDRVRGTRERCVEWVVDKAEARGEAPSV